MKEDMHLAGARDEEKWWMNEVEVGGEIEKREGSVNTHPF